MHIVLCLATQYDWLINFVFPQTCEKHVVMISLTDSSNMIYKNLSAVVISTCMFSSNIVL